MLFEIVSAANVPLVLSRKKLLCADPVTFVVVMLAVPARFLSSSPSSVVESPLELVLLPASENPVTFDPLIPSSLPFWMFIDDRFTFAVLVSEIPVPSPSESFHPIPPSPYRSLSSRPAIPWC